MRKLICWFIGHRNICLERMGYDLTKGVRVDRMICLRWKQDRAPLSNYEALCVTYELLILMYQEDIRDLEKKLKAVRHKVEKQKTKQGEGT